MAKYETNALVEMLSEPVPVVAARLMSLLLKLLPKPLLPLLPLLLTLLLTLRLPELSL